MSEASNSVANTSSTSEEQHHYKRRWKELSQQASDDTAFTSAGVKQLRLLIHLALGALLLCLALLSLSPISLFLMLACLFCIPQG